MTRKIIYRIVSKLLPEIKLLRKDIPWNELENYMDNCEISRKSVVFPRYYLINVEINDYSYISGCSRISNTKIGKFCSIGPNLTAGWGIHPTNGISTSPFFYSKNKIFGLSLSKEDKIIERKEIKIGNDVFIGMNVTILDGVTIHDGAIIGAGAVVSKDIPPYAIAVGCPIKTIKFRFNEKQIESLLSIKWWNFPEDKLVEIERDLFDIDSFINKYY